MAEYIDRTQIKWYGCDHEGRACIPSGGHCEKCFFGTCDHDEVMSIKPADVAPVVHGKWIKGRTKEKVDWLGVRCKVANYSCSICGRMINDIDVDGKGLVDTLEDYPYCHCGAKMDKEGQE